MDPSPPQPFLLVDELRELTASGACPTPAFCTWSCLQTIDTCRQCCGGHGYSAYSGFPAMYNDFAVQCTVRRGSQPRHQTPLRSRLLTTPSDLSRCVQWEGDNTILSLQAGRSLISSYQDARKGKALPPGVAYLARPAALTATSSGKLDLDDIDGAWATAAANLVRKVTTEYEADVQAGQSKEVAMEACSQARFVAAKVHTVGYIFRAVRVTPSFLPMSSS